LPFEIGFDKSFEKCIEFIERFRRGSVAGSVAGVWYLADLNQRKERNTMKNNVILTIPMVPLLFILTGCLPGMKKPLEPMSIEDALASMGRGFVQMKKAQLDANDGKEFKTGLVPSEAEVTFVISRASTKDGRLYVELSPIALGGAPIGGKAGAEAGSSTSKNVGNTITVKFKSLLFATTSKTTSKNGDVTVSVQGVTDPEQLKKIYDTLEDIDFGFKSAHRHQ
jgi:hypothetical protein